MIQPRGPRRRRPPAGALPGVQPDMVMIPARRKKRRRSPQPLGYFKTQHAPVKAERPRDVCDFQMDMANVNSWMNGRRFHAASFPEFSARGNRFRRSPAGSISFFPLCRNSVSARAEEGTSVPHGRGVSGRGVRLPPTEAPRPRETEFRPSVRSETEFRNERKIGNQPDFPAQEKNLLRVIVGRGQRGLPYARSHMSGPDRLDSGIDAPCDEFVCRKAPVGDYEFRRKPEVFIKLFFAVNYASWPCLIGSSLDRRCCRLSASFCSVSRPLGKR